MRPGEEQNLAADQADDRGSGLELKKDGYFSARPLCVTK
jgi:hypothetical protein